MIGNDRWSEGLRLALFPTVGVKTALHLFLENYM